MFRSPETPGETKNDEFMEINIGFEIRVATTGEGRRQHDQESRKRDENQLERCQQCLQVIIMALVILLILILSQGADHRDPGGPAQGE